MRRTVEKTQTDLFVDWCPFTKDSVTEDATGEERVPAGSGTLERAGEAFLDASESDGDDLVEGRKLAEVDGVHAGGTEDEGELLAWCAAAKEEGHDQRMWEADLGTIYETISTRLGYGQDVMVCWVERDLCESLFDTGHGGRSNRQPRGRSRSSWIIRRWCRWGAG